MNQSCESKHELNVEQQKQEYFQNLFKQFPNKINQVQKQIEFHNIKFQDKIYNGKYQIKQGQYYQKPKSPVSQDGLREINRLKSKLQSKLNYLEQNIQIYSSQTQKHVGVTLSDKQYQQHIKNIAKAKKQLQQQKSFRAQQQERKSKQKEVARIKLLQEQKNEQNKKKKQQIEQKIKKINESKQKRKIDIDAQNKLLNNIMQTKTLHQKLQSKYLQFQALSLQDKKKKLAQIRSLHKPISKQELQQHEKKIQQFKQKINKEKQISQQNKQGQMKIPHIYKSKWYKKVEKEDFTEDNAQQEAENQRAKEAKQKIKQYSLYVRSKFKPEIDEKKFEQMRQLNASVNKVELKGDEPKKIGLQYLRYSKQLANTNAKITTDTSQNSLPPRSKPINYLDDLKRNRHTRDQSEIIDSIMKKPIDQSEKAKLVLVHATKLQEMAKRKQQLARNNKQGGDQELDEIYVKAIKAKLALLN